MLYDLPLSTLETPVLREGLLERGSYDNGLDWSYFIPEMTTKRQST